MWSAAAPVHSPQPNPREWRRVRACVSGLRLDPCCKSVSSSFITDATDAKQRPLSVFGKISLRTSASRSVKSPVCQTGHRGTPTMPPSAQAAAHSSRILIFHLANLGVLHAAPRARPAGHTAQWLAGGTRRHRHVSLVAKGGPLQHPDELRALLLGHEPGDAREHLGTVRLIHGHELLLHQLDALAVVDCL